ncbi:predicted protein [Histoplasma capsulatum var. duboisii H88]|uniref:Predicted protein n=1 Tax=Ajellomyces capsulatus (strain H88) TaxID=544711 RepID=F0UCD9_AJEC8|nr:predicted protein [Histoplasma capsulatum var. duboisii H88]
MATTIPTHIHTGPEAQVPRPDLTGSSGANSGPPDEGSLLGRYYPSERSRKTHTQYSGTFAVCCTILSFGVRSQKLVVQPVNRRNGTVNMPQVQPVVVLLRELKECTTCPGPRHTTAAYESLLSSSASCLRG